MSQGITHDLQDNFSMLMMSNKKSQEQAKR
jgi:hypothetical protein